MIPVTFEVLSIELGHDAGGAVYGSLERASDGAVRPLCQCEHVSREAAVACGRERSIPALAWVASDEYARHAGDACAWEAAVRAVCVRVERNGG